MEGIFSYIALSALCVALYLIRREKRELKNRDKGRKERVFQRGCRTYTENEIMWESPEKGLDRLRRDLGLPDDKSAKT